MHYIILLLQTFLKTSRPRFWIYLMGPYIIWWITGSDVNNIHSILSTINFQFIWFLLYFSYPANVLVYGINDIFDYETDKLNSKKQWYEWLIAPDKQKELSAIMLILNIPFLFLSILPNPISYLWIFIFVWASIIYSAPPLRAKSKPIFDTIVSALIYIAPWYIWYYISWWTWFNRFIFCALLSRNIAMHAYSAIPDIQSDQQANIHTVATLYKKHWTLLFCLFFYTLATILIIPNLWWFAGIGVIYIALMLFSFKVDIIQLYKLFPYINAWVGFLLFRYIIIFKIWIL